MTYSCLFESAKNIKENSVCFFLIHIRFRIFFVNVFSALEMKVPDQMLRGRKKGSVKIQLEGSK